MDLSAPARCGSSSAPPYIHAPASAHAPPAQEASGWPRDPLQNSPTAQRCSSSRNQSSTSRVDAPDVSNRLREPRHDARPAPRPRRRAAIDRRRRQHAARCGRAVGGLALPCSAPTASPRVKSANCDLRSSSKFRIAILSTPVPEPAATSRAPIIPPPPTPNKTQ